MPSRTTRAIDYNLMIRAFEKVSNCWEDVNVSLTFVDVRKNREYISKDNTSIDMHELSNKFVCGFKFRKNGISLNYT